jgi:hypothetical protein
MNGKPLIIEGFCDFDDPLRRTEIGKHTTIEAFERSKKRAQSGGDSIYGWVWAEFPDPQSVNPIPMRPRKMHEVVVGRHQAGWLAARDRARVERPGVCWWVATPSCCSKLVAVPLEEHQKSVRHFFYTAMEFQELTVRLWPWMKPLIAEEVLCEK